MATKYDVQPGTFESISGDEIGTFILNEWTHFKLDGVFPFLVSDVIIKQGAATVPGSAYELATDSDATTQESGLTGKTLIGQIRITNATYVGVTLNFTGNNFGTYASNQAVTEAIASGLLEKVQPGSDAFIDLGEPAIFNSTSGLQIVSDNSGEIAKWDPGPVFSVPGTLARLEGLTFSATGEALNQNKNPLDPNNSLFWYMPEDENDLLRYANRGTVIDGDMHTIHDRASGNYNVNLKIGKKKINSVQQEFHIIHLDGTVVTGNTTLENLFDVGGGNEYKYLDIFAPDVVGTRTLLDMGEYLITPQSVSGENDTLGELQDDTFQDHQHIAGGYVQNNTADINVWGYATNNPAGQNTTQELVTGGVEGGERLTASSPASEATLANITNEIITKDPNTGLTTRPKELTVGSSYIVVMAQA